MNYMLNGKDTIICLIVRLIKKFDNLVKKTDYKTKWNFMKLKIKFLLIMIVINILLLKNLIS